ncbi:MAG: Hsp70 family protein [Alphaproteobacteria bacterium]|nr:Hsp70 family protein [Alphaproteobacteria bacterium]
MDRTILGIDLGITSLTMAAFGDDGRPRVIPNADGEDATSAVLHLYDADGVVIGSEARKMAAIEPENVVEDAPWRLGEADWRPTMHERTWTAQELVALVLRKMREDANELRGGDVRKAVLAVPAWYDSARRNAAVDAARIAGFEVLSLVNQPLAAALGVGAQQLEADGPVVVFDLGGRDLEVTVLLKEREMLTVRASQVRYDLCVRAFELRLRSLLVERYRAEAGGSTETEDEMLAQQVVDAAHNALTALAHRDGATTRIAYGGVEVRTTIDRATFGLRTAPLLASAITLIDQVLSEAGHRADDAIACIAVGRGTLLPNVQKALRERFGARLMLPEHPDRCIALGASLLAVLRHDRKHPGLTATPLERTRIEPTLDDETPYGEAVADESMSSSAMRAIIGLADGGHEGPLPRARDAITQDLGLIALDHDRRVRVIPLIPKGTPVPCEVKGRFTYAYHGMTAVRVEVTEGRGTRREDVAVIGVVELRGLPPRPVGTPIEILYSYGVDQILKVAVHDVQSGIRQDVEIAYRGGMSASDVRQAARMSDTMHVK